MNKTRKKLHVLLDKWGESVNEKGFSRDGVLFKHPDKDERYNKWDEAEKRVLFIAKEPRENSGDIAEHWVENYWYAKFQYLYILSVCDANLAITNFADITTKDKIDARLENTPFAWINVKKTIGGATANSKEIVEHLKEYGDLLLEQIKILKPTDIICLCGNNNCKLRKKLEKLTPKPNIYTAHHPAYRRSLATKYASLKPTPKCC